MQRTSPEGRGPVRYGPPAPETGLPVLPELAAVLAAAGERAEGEPPGGGPELCEAAGGYWWRRGLRSRPDELAAAAGAQALLFALIGAYGGDVLMPRPCPVWWTPQVRLLGRPAYHVPTPAECGGVPDPFALLETVRRVRAEGGVPRLLLLSVVDDPTATVAPPETVREACEAAVGEGLHIISDETWRDTLHRPHETVLLSPAEMCPEDVTVISDLAGALTPASWPVAVARFPPTEQGIVRRARTLDILTALGAVVAAPIAAAAAHALGEPGPVTARAVQAAALHARVAAAAHRAVLVSGALARPPQAGRHLYVDLGPLRSRLAERGVNDSMELEEYLTDRLGTPVPGGHRFGDELGALRVRLATGPLLGATPEQRLESLTSPTPLELPHVAEALRTLGTAFDELR
ncbi:aminotransferase class I/II-fold pyridoxal phosphate-dependent enzyme [Streptomyces lunaelactis]|uniref:aminotransferase class I/II-fold pyridoxal phosphate-dependent enzyme n=2 Tax=Streptomyces lunaelactis TaxID=1535768 RepID=UPI001585C87A|nr:aminotransferase class I/II-fold pyridoxal phosphate-dependent enzyme [Streptomyces lunaelactis]NUK05485.1 aminotransferase class I/II-fold pyridoxal phosphate-dependent enzyme [Streptomyces lunaelactis]NUK09432.1 aminotransferase class I/II-fold pyridoxal phosphate-dependent enzyme [Streptomyces lunaelactis]NUK26807.1 aminotransferase class I/II-fold pyridoxal phosphate-dependent enzyme [Streptomyces lunaelactis]NUK38101.1 aminotransferase class I/II-fold pyridoxal phosphate-dependent enzym